MKHFLAECGTCRLSNALRAAPASCIFFQHLQFAQRPAPLSPRAFLMTHVTVMSRNKTCVTSRQEEELAGGRLGFCKNERTTSCRRYDFEYSRGAWERNDTRYIHGMGRGCARCDTGETVYIHGVLRAIFRFAKDEYVGANSLLKNRRFCRTYTKTSLFPGVYGA